MGVADLGSGKPWEWRTLGVADPESGVSWELRTLGVANRRSGEPSLCLKMVEQTAIIGRGIMQQCTRHHNADSELSK